MVEINRSWVFSNNTYIFRKDGTQIDPNSQDGKIIQGIVFIQEQVREQNIEARKKWIIATFPNDEGKQKDFMEKFGIKDLVTKDVNRSDKKIANPK